MGSYSPVDGFDSERVAELVQSIHAPVLEELARRGSPFLGVLFAGLMLTEDGPTVLEFNCRFGDPEAQTILASLDGDLLPALAMSAGGDLSRIDGIASDQAAVTVVVAAGSYPDGAESRHPDRGCRRRGTDRGARVPRGTAPERRHSRHERRADPGGHRTRRDARGRAWPGLCRRRADLVPRRSLSSRHRQCLSSLSSGS